MRADHLERLTTTSTIAEVPGFSESLDLGSLVRALAAIFQRNPELPGVLLSEGDGITSAVSRRYYFDSVGRNCGMDLYHPRPIRLMMNRFDELGGALSLPSRLPIQEAVRRGLERPRELLNEPLIVELEAPDERGLPARPVTVRLLEEPVHQPLGRMFLHRRRGMLACTYNEQEGWAVATTTKKAVQTPPARQRIRRSKLNVKRLQQMPELYRALTDTAGIVELEVRQGLAALHDPEKYPVAVSSGGGTPTSIAQAAQRWAATLPAGDRRRIARRAAEEVPATLTAVANRYQLNLRSPKPIHQQLTPPMAPKPGAETILRQLTQLQNELQAAGGIGQLLAKPRPAAGRRAAPPVPRQDAGKIVEIRFRMHQLTCIEDTTERFRDEISLAGVASDDEGEVATIAPLYLGKFKKGDVEAFDPPKVLATLSTDDFVADFPHTFQASLVLSELELPRLLRVEDFLLKLFLTLFVGGAIVEGAGLALAIFSVATGIVLLNPATLLAITIVATVVALVGLLLAAATLLEGLNPEVFPTQAAVITLPDNATGFDGVLVSPLDSLDFEAFGGHYRLDFTWELIKQE